MPPEGDSAVAEAFGITDANAPDAGNDENQQDSEQAQEAEDVAFEQLPTSWQDEIRRLRRENAAARVARRDATKAGNADAPTNASPQALRAAEDRGRDAARMEFGVRLAGAEVKAALAGAMTEEQIADLIDDLNLSRFVLDDGEVDREAVKVLRDKYVSIIGKKPVARVGHGQRNGAPTQKSNADLFGDWLAGTG